MRKLAGFSRAGFLCFLLLSRGSSLASPAPGDDQDRVTSGGLAPQAEKISQANARYADALGRAAAGDRPGAVAELRQVISIDPHFIDADVHLANLLVDLQRPDEAYDVLNAALTANPGTSTLSAAMSRVEQARGHTAEAQRLSDAAMKKSPSSLDAMQAKLALGESRHELESAVAGVTTQLKAVHAPVESYLQLVNIYLDLTGKENPQPSGDVVQRTLLGVYQVAITQGTPTVDLLSVLSDTYRDLNQAPAAFKTLRQAVALDPHNTDLILRCAALAGDAGEKQDERRLYEQAYAIDPAIEGIRANLARLYYENGEYQKALRVMKLMLTRSPHDAMLQVKIGVTCDTLQRGTEARSWFAKALASPSCPLDAYLKLAAYLVNVQRLPEAADVLAQGERNFPDSPDLRFYDAVEKADSHDVADALDSFRMSQKLSHGDPSAMGVNFYLEGSAILTATGHRGEVDSVLQQGLDKFPDDISLLNQQAWDWAEEGTHFPEALAAAKKATALAPGDGQMLDTLGYVYLKMNKAAEALPILQRAAKMTNNDPSVLQHLGDAYLAQGRKSEAVAAWRLALQKDPANPDLKTRIGKPSAHDQPHPAPSP